MGLYDHVACRYPLPPEVPPERDWQSKDTTAQALQYYEIRQDGTLWRKLYGKEPQWAQEQYTGELEIHDLDDHHWYSVQLWFRDGVVRDLVASVTPRRKAPICAF